MVIETSAVPLGFSTPTLRRRSQKPKGIVKRGFGMLAAVLTATFIGIRAWHYFAVHFKLDLQIEGSAPDPRHEEAGKGGTQ